VGQFRSHLRDQAATLSNPVQMHVTLWPMTWFSAIAAIDPTAFGRETARRSIGKGAYRAMPLPALAFNLAPGANTHQEPRQIEVYLGFITRQSGQSHTVSR
jgi:hypothetical protein